MRANALKHGLRAETLDILPHEDPERFARRLDAWNRRYLPADEIEAQAVYEVALLSWRIDRSDRHENAVLSRRVIDAMALGGEDGTGLLEAAEIASFDPSHEGEQLRRYQFALRRAFLRALDALNKLQREREKSREAAARAEAIGMNKAIAPAPNKANFETVRQECRTHEVAAAPNKPNSMVPSGDLRSSVPAGSGDPRRAQSSVPAGSSGGTRQAVDVAVNASAPNKANRAERKRRKRLERQFALARRANQGHSGK